MVKVSSDQKLHELLDLITWGYRAVNVDGTSYLFRPLTLEEQNIANIMYNNSVEELKAAGRLERKKLRRKAIQSNLWSETKEKDLELLRKELDCITKDIQLEKEANKARRKASKKLIKLEQRHSYIEDIVNKLQIEYNTYIELPSIEYQAEMDRGTYYLACSTLTFPDKKQFWSSYHDCLNEENRYLVRRLLNLYYTYKVANESEIRAIARSGYWRVKWLNSRKNRGVYTLFGREMYDLTIDQFRLVQWSQIYDSVYESMEPPSDDIIEDDERLDKWLSEQAEKRKQERKNKSLSNKFDKIDSNAQEAGFTVDGFYSDKCTCGVKDMDKSLGRLHDRSCPYGVYLYYKDKEQISSKIEEIQSANPSDIRKRLAAEQRRLATNGSSIEEQHLRNDPKTRAMFGMPTNIVGKDGSFKGRQ